MRKSTKRLLVSISQRTGYTQEEVLHWAMMLADQHLKFHPQEDYLTASKAFYAEWTARMEHS